VGSVTDPYGRVLGFLDRSRYFIFQAAPQLCSRGSVDHVPDPESRSAGNKRGRGVMMNFTACMGVKLGL
jgi:hypothetical protein